MTTPVRGYDLQFPRAYAAPPVPPEQPAPPRPEPVGLPEIIWRGININPGWADEEFTAIVEDVEGWYGTPPLNGNDAELALADGAAWGPKVIGPRTIAITGAAAGPRAQLMDWRDQLAWLAAERQPAELSVSDPELGITLAAMTRAGTESFRHTFFAGRFAFRYQVALTAADPLLYARDWRQVVLTTATAADAGRRYPRLFTEHEPAASGWRYGSGYPPGSADYLANPGSADAPVFAVYRGDLTDARLTDDRTGMLLTPPLGAGQEITVATRDLIAEAAGGQSRATFILPGSHPMVIPARSTQRWHLYSQGSGSVTLTWRPAWV